VAARGGAPRRRRALPAQPRLDDLGTDQPRPPAHDQQFKGVPRPRPEAGPARPQPPGV